METRLRRAAALAGAIGTDSPEPHVSDRVDGLSVDNTMVAGGDVKIPMQK